jgi:hypothetical protein
MLKIERPIDYAFISPSIFDFIIAFAILRLFYFSADAMLFFICADIRHCRRHFFISPLRRCFADIVFIADFHFRH